LVFSQAVLHLLSKKKKMPFIDLARKYVSARFANYLPANSDTETYDNSPEAMKKKQEYQKPWVDKTLQTWMTYAKKIYPLLNSSVPPYTKK
jgi:hypothetical protein